MVRTDIETAILEYDAATNVLHVLNREVHLETAAEIDRHFDRILSFWRRNCGGRRVYCVIAIAGFTFNLKETDRFAKRLRLAVQGVGITLVRYGGDPLQRAGVRLISLKAHMPSHIYVDRDEAFAAVAAMAAGRIAIAEGPAG